MGRNGLDGRVSEGPSGKFSSLREPPAKSSRTRPCSSRRSAAKRRLEGSRRRFAGSDVRRSIGSDRRRDDERRAILPREEGVHVVIARGLGRRIEVEASTEAIGRVREVAERRGDVALLDRRIELLLVARTYGLGEVLVVIAAPSTRRSGLAISTEEGPVRVVARDDHVAFRAVEEDADRRALLLVRHPVTHLEDEELVLIRVVERRHHRVRSLLIVLE